MRTPSHSLRAALAVGATLAALVVIGGFVGKAWPHSWYTGTRDPVTGYSCCGGNDCHQIPRQSVLPIDGGYQVTLHPGDHPLVTKVHVFIVEQTNVQPSHDGDFHLCLYPDEDHLRCFFAPSSGA